MKLMGILTLAIALLVGEAHGSTIAKGWHDHADLLADVSDKTGLDIKVLATVGSLESSFRPKVKARGTTATGLFQFTNRTWRVTLQSYGEQYGLASNANRKDPYANALMGAEYLKENSRVLRKKLGREPTLVELYMSHLIAPRRVAVLNVINPNANMVTLYPKLARYNRPLFFHKSGHSRTVREFKRNIADKVNRAFFTYRNVADQALAMFIKQRNDEMWRLANVGNHKTWLCDKREWVREWGGKLTELSSMDLLAMGSSWFAAKTKRSLENGTDIPKPSQVVIPVQPYVDRRRLA